MFCVGENFTIGRRIVWLDLDDLYFMSLHGEFVFFILFEIVAYRNPLFFFLYMKMVNLRSALGIGLYFNLMEFSWMIYLA